MIKKCSITALLGVLKYRTISVHIYKHYTIWVRLNSIRKTTRKNITHSLPRNIISHRNNRTVNEKENIYALGDKCGQTPHTKRSKKKKKRSHGLPSNWMLSVWVSTMPDPDMRWSCLIMVLIVCVWTMGARVGESEKRGRQTPWLIRQADTETDRQTNM